MDWGGLGGCKGAHSPFFGALKPTAGLPYRAQVAPSCPGIPPLRAQTAALLGGGQGGGGWS